MSVLIDRLKLHGYTHYRAVAEKMCLLKPSACVKCKATGYITAVANISKELASQHFSEAADGLPILYGKACDRCRTK